MNSQGNILISGASFAGLATAFWMKKLGFNVTIVEIAPGLRRGGTPVNIKDRTVETMRRMCLLERIQANKLAMETPEWVNSEGVVEASGFEQHGSSFEQEDGGQSLNEEYEIERDVLLDLMFEAVEGEVEIVFGDSFTSLKEVEGGIEVTFNKRAKQTFELVFGCDGVHSSTRKFWFGAEKEFSHFLKAYGSVSIIHKLLIPQNSVRIFREPGKMIVLSAYNHKTDIILMFHSETEVSYEYRDEAQKRNMVIETFSGSGWRTRELPQSGKGRT